METLFIRLSCYNVVSFEIEAGVYEKSEKFAKMFYEEITPRCNLPASTGHSAMWH